MRVLFVVTDTRRGGTPLRIAQLARGMASRGHDVVVASVLPAGDVLAGLRAEGIETMDLGLRSPARAIPALRALRAELRRRPPDVVQSALFHANVLARLATLGTGVPVVSGYHSVDDDKPGWRVLLDRATAPRAAAHVAVSEAVAARAASRERLPLGRIHVIPLGRDAARFAPRGDRDAVRARFGIPIDAQVVGWVGRMHPVKGLDRLLHAVAELPGWWALLAGWGEERDRLVELAGSLGIADRVVFAGEVEDPAPVLEAVDVFCLPSRWEGFPGALLEAMAAGLPVVAHDVGGVAELVEDGVTGLLVVPGDASVLARTIALAAGRPELGDAARTHVAVRFSEAAFLDAHESTWRSVVS